MDVTVNEQTPPLLRPVHRWFWFWDDVISSIYRVIAVAVGAAITTGVVVALLPVPWWLVGPVALASWIGLAVLQEHDERVSLPVDGEFLEQLHIHVDPVMATAGYEFVRATGANRARQSSEEYVYERNGEDSITCRRNVFAKTMSIIAWRDGQEDEPNYLPHDVAARLAVSVDPKSDAQVLADALTAWVSDPSLRLPASIGSGRTRVRRSGWFNYR